MTGVEMYEGFTKCGKCGTWGESVVDCAHCSYMLRMALESGRLGIRPESGWSCSGAYRTESKCPKCDAWQMARWAGELTPPGLVWDKGCVQCGYDAIVEAECELRPCKAKACGNR